MGAARNSCEVSFPEFFAIPGLSEAYKLVSVVTHRGWHDSGHYICYRRRKRLARQIQETKRISSREHDEFGMDIEKDDPIESKKGDNEETEVLSDVQDQIDVGIEAAGDETGEKSEVQILGDHPLTIAEIIEKHHDKEKSEPTLDDTRKGDNPEAKTQIQTSTEPQTQVSENYAIPLKPKRKEDLLSEPPESHSKWWEISDESVVGVTREDVLSKQKGAYILFYQKIPAKL
jgi:ubiquitin carboxyl-terminal hydrolase 16